MMSVRCRFMIFLAAFCGKAANLHSAFADTASLVFFHSTFLRGGFACLHYLLSPTGIFTTLFGSTERVWFATVNYPCVTGMMHGPLIQHGVAYYITLRLVSV